jgi:hypothetical protein
VSVQTINKIENFGSAKKKKNSKDKQQGTTIKLSEKCQSHGVREWPFWSLSFSGHKLQHENVKFMA